MIDHVSIAVRDLAGAAHFYEAVLGAIGLSKLVDRTDTIGFGKRYPEFWVNRRADMPPIPANSGVHICLRARSVEMVQAFHAAALRAGGVSDGEPGPRPEYSTSYYAAFVRDPEGNRIEAVTFMDAATD